MSRPALPSLWDQPPPPPEAGTVEGRFRAFHRANPFVYRALVARARALRRRGHTRYSIKGLYEVVRFELAEAHDGGAEPALNNDYTPHYARLIMEQEPDLRGFFETRQRRAP